MGVLGLLILVLAAAMMVGWRNGVRTNRSLLLDTCAAAERVFAPTDTSYTNIGGLIGYNFAYQLPDSDTFRRLDGTITMLPRQALLYYPLSRFMGREDNLILTLFCDRLAPGQGHIVEQRQFSRGWIPIEDSESMQFETLECDGHQFLLFSYNPIIRALLQRLFDRLARASRLRHIGYYGSGGYVALRLHPGGSDMETQLADAYRLLQTLPQPPRNAALHSAH
ncbi:MAG: hypothetical protein EA384_12865 [Spirochaetaceae bacterium]|nr:MAG: hypothetical protein EA384_12865 [Spirochaetaceae bacterium]